MALQTRGESGEGSRSVVRGDRVRMGYGVSGAGRSASRLASTFFREADRLCSIVRIGTGDDARSRRWKLGRSPPRPAPVNAGCDCHRRRRGFRAALHATTRPMSRDIKNPQARHLGRSSPTVVVYVCTKVRWPTGPISPPANSPVTARSGPRAACSSAVSTPDSP